MQPEQRLPGTQCGGVRASDRRVMMPGRCDLQQSKLVHRRSAGIAGHGSAAIPEVREPLPRAMLSQPASSENGP